ncbi:TMEM175 family protein [Streptococcus sp. CCH8-C6]|uniref:TMEM175 family protein n=1 Tax=Streptococcus sp. CCH8-C6 TaxID=1768777 RepID=UPI000769D357|nr:TMEM175 family protein [Streptococcus sp. CCH8-C6]
MSKERMMAFTDALLAIIMTVLILELQKPAQATWQAVWDLRENFAVYGISFFWLTVMWINLHNEWQHVKQITISVIWWNMFLLFTASFFPYMTSFAGSHFYSSVAATLYVAEALLVTFAFYGLGHAVHEANPDLPPAILTIYGQSKQIDYAIKILGLVFSPFIYPPVGPCSVVLSALWIIYKMKLYKVRPTKL